MRSEDDTRSTLADCCNVRLSIINWRLLQPEISIPANQTPASISAAKHSLSVGVGRSRLPDCCRLRVITLPHAGDNRQWGSASRCVTGDNGIKNTPLNNTRC